MDQRYDSSAIYKAVNLFKGQHINELRNLKCRATVSPSSASSQRVLSLNVPLPNVLPVLTQLTNYLASEESKLRLRLLMPNVLVGCIIGKSGERIKQIQADSDAKLIVSKDPLPNSSDRLIDIIANSANVYVY